MAHQAHRHAARGADLRFEWRAARRLVHAVTVALILVGSSAFATRTQEGTPPNLQSGKAAPDINLTNLSGTSVSIADSNGAVRVIIFGSTSQPRSADALRIIHETASEVIKGTETAVRILYLVATDEDAAAVRAAVKRPAGPPEVSILLDPDRVAFGDYDITVLPTVVVVDEKGFIVHVTAGLLPRFAREMTGALQVAAGQISMGEFDQMLHAEPAEEVSPEHQRAERIAHMASKIAARGLFEAALDQYLEAIEIAPDYLPARLAAAHILLNLEKWDDAEPHLKAALEIHPQSLDAALGLAEIALARANPEKTGEAEALARDIVTRSPSNPRAHYLLARACEMKGETEEALSHYRRAAELLFEEALRREEP